MPNCNRVDSNNQWNGFFLGVDFFFILIIQTYPLDDIAEI